jgi:hypothetical protein
MTTPPTLVAHECAVTDRVTPRTDEAAARELLAPYIAGNLIAWDDKTAPRMWDFCEVAGDRSHASTVEITRAADRPRLEFEIWLREAGTVWDVPGLGSSWWVLLRVATNPHKVVRAAVCDLLREFAGLGLDSVTDNGFKPWRDALKAHGIQALLRRTGDVDVVHVSTMGQFWTGSYHVADRLRDEAEANRQKLSDAPGPRQLFVWIDWSELPATFEMRDHPDAVPVELPAWVDIAWAACGEWSHDQAILWRAVNGEPWTVVRPYVPPENTMG